MYIPLEASKKDAGGAQREIAARKYGSVGENDEIVSWKQGYSAVSLAI
jgi:hypothetical protein